MKKVLAVVLLITLAVTGAFAKGEVEKEASGNKVTMSSWFPRPIDGAHDQIGEFMAANPDVDLDYQIFEGSKYEELLRTKITSNDIPDVMALMTPQVANYGKLGILADLSDTEAGRMQAQLPSLNKALSVDGKTVAINGSGGVVQHTIFYNKVIFDRYGIEEPKSRQEFEEACETLKQAGEDVILYGGSDTWPYKYAQFPFGFNSQVAVALQKAGTSDLMEALYKGVTPSEIYGDSLRYFEKLVKKGYIAKTGLTMTWPESFTHFTDGNAAMLPQGPWIIGMVNNQIDPPIDPERFELGVMFFPAEPYEGKTYYQGYMEYNFALSTKGAKNPDAVKLFEFLTSKENLTAELSSHGRPTLFPLELKTDSPVQKKMNSDLVGDDIEIVIFSYPEVTGWGESQMPNAYKAIHAGETVERVLEELDYFYEDHKADLNL